MPDLPKEPWLSPFGSTPAAADDRQACVPPGEAAIHRDTWDALAHDVVTCRACPRLVTWREEVAATKRRAFQDWTYWGKPVPGFGDHNARLLILGLAPGAHGSNRTGRMFTGDSSGKTLYATLYRTGFANQATWESPDDGLILSDAYITAVGRCAPPQNKPTADELSNCRPFLRRELALMDNLQVVLALGRIALDGYLRLLQVSGHTLPPVAFGHGIVTPLPAPLPTIITSYHPSRQNTQTGRLTVEMFDRVFLLARDLFR